ncbi:MAG TPA: hypothetical protein VFF06_31860 [Polyangia bacterium]|nr:hypothetical protein [Polyangia bacterium]
MESAVVLTVRGTLIPQSLEAARKLHNETAGSEQGIAAARSLGDLSHNVYAPSERSKQSGAKAGELLFVDRWDNPKGIMEFFSNAHVQQQAGKMFSARDAAVWMAARGSFSYHLPAPKAKTDRYVGLIRAVVKSPEQAVAIFAGVDAKAQRDARRRGLVSHELFIKLAAPGDASPVELLGIDLWCDFAGMTEHYGDQTHMSGLAGAFAGAPQVSVWEQAPGQWSEW